MLKRYAAPNTVTWSGRAWEIRHALRREIRLKGGNARLADSLPAGCMPEQPTKPAARAPRSADRADRRDKGRPFQREPY